MELQGQEYSKFEQDQQKMKITLRKIRSSPLGENYLHEFFTPIQSDTRKCVVSITLNPHSSQFFNIQKNMELVGKDLTDICIQ